MARKKTPTLTDGENRLMSIIWELGEATVNDVVEALPKRQPLAYNTVLTSLVRLAQKKNLQRVKSGRAHVYQPLVSHKQARLKVVRHMVRSFFNDSPELLLLNIIENEKLTTEELQHLKEMIDKKG